MKLNDKTYYDIADKSIDYIKYIAENFGDRNSSSLAEKQTQDYIVNEIQKINKGKVIQDKYDIYPKAYSVALPIIAVLLLLSFLSYFKIALISLFLLTLAFTIFLFEIILNVRLLDLFFPQKSAYNTMWIKQNEQAKKRVIVSSYVDAPYEKKINKKYGNLGNITVNAMSIVGAIYLFVISIVATVNHFIDTFNYNDFLFLSINKFDITLSYFLGYIVIIFIPFWLILLFRNNKKYVTLGVGNNLCANAICISVIQALQKENIVLNDTELCILLLSAGNNGHRGSKAFVKSHKNDFTDKTTYLINLDTVNLKKNLHLIKNEVLGKSSKDFNDFIINSALENNVIINEHSDFANHYESTILKDLNIKSTTITGKSSVDDKTYTRFDNLENFELESLFTVLKLVNSTILDIDKQ